MKRLFIVIAAFILVACSPKPEWPKVEPKEEKTSYVCKVTVNEDIASYGPSGNLNHRTKKTYERYYSFHVTFSPFLRVDPTLPPDQQVPPGLPVRGAPVAFFKHTQLSHLVVFNDEPFQGVDIDEDNYKRVTKVYVNEQKVSVDEDFTFKHNGKPSTNRSIRISFDPITKVFSHSSYYRNKYMNGGDLESIDSNGLCEPVKK